MKHLLILLLSVIVLASCQKEVEPQSKVLISIRANMNDGSIKSEGTINISPSKSDFVPGYLYAAWVENKTVYVDFTGNHQTKVNAYDVLISYDNGTNWQSIALIFPETGAVAHRYKLFLKLK